MPLDPGQLRAIAAKAVISADHVDDVAERLLNEAEKTTADEYGETLGRIVRDLRRASYVARVSAQSALIVAEKIAAQQEVNVNAKDN